MRWMTGVLVFALTAVDAVGQSMPIYSNLGVHSYRVSSTEQAQRYFNQGLRLLWAFNHAESVRSFREAERLDPACAMCPWGIALASGPNINAPMEPAGLDSARAAVTRAQQIPTTEAEQRLIAALAARYASGSAADRVLNDSAYADAMARVVALAPDDLEARVLYADALMNLSPWNYWNGDGTPRQATSIILEQLEHAMAVNAAHPGACHLFIHAVEAADPRRALPCAERLAALMPGAGHLVHMPGHIYIRVGRYADAIVANQHAVHADQEFLEGPAARRRGVYGSGYYPHNHHFLAFAASMAGSSRLAIEHGRTAARGVDPDVAAEIPWIDAITPIGYWTLVTFGRWDEILAEPLPASTRRFTTGMAYYARGVAFAARRRWAEARAALDSVSRIAAGHPAGENRVALEIAEHALQGEIALRRGALSEAVREFRAAVALEDRLPYTEPPTWYYPMRHSLGKAYLAQRRGDEAERVYREDLARFPDNGWSLYGLTAALKQQGRLEEAAQVLQQFRAAWVDADVTLVGSRF
ncbi:MAG: tetratricopeptide repeat protein [Gemmatimonadales bacterium]